ncbi:c-type cytochrome [Rhodoferax sp.]|uniref:c-type cytochrome n=1 Tax=Rhodoferax sp. TaxID=50421 RepID=UPI00374DDC74
MKHLLIQWAAVWLVLVSAAGCGDRNIGSSEKPTSSPAAPAAAAKVSVAAPAAAAAKVSTAAPAAAAKVTAAAAKVTAAAPADIDAAQALFKRNSCNKCHSVDKTKTGPSLQKIAAKYSGKADGQEKIIKNMTMAPKIKFEDGTEEEHKVIDTTDQKELKNLSDWILSQ